MNIRLLLVLLLGLCCPVWAAVEATPLPEVVQHDFYRQVWVAAGNLTVLGIIGLFVCTANKVKLHNGLGDIYLSAPVSLVCWAGLAWLLYMATAAMICCRIWNHACGWPAAWWVGRCCMRW